MLLLIYFISGDLYSDIKKCIYPEDFLFFGLRGLGPAYFASPKAAHFPPFKVICTESPCKKNVSRSYCREHSWNIPGCETLKVATVDLLSLIKPTPIGC